MKNRTCILLRLVIGVLILQSYSVGAQLTCGSAQEIVYTGPNIQAVVTFTTVGVPNDNSSALPVYCTTPVGTAGQHWYSLSLENQYTVPVSVTTDLEQTNFDTKLHVYTGTCGALTCVAGDDDSGTGSTSTVIFDALPNTTYLIRVGGYNNESGITAISIDAGYLGCTDPNASNFDIWSVVDDGSCCYNGYLELSPDAPVNALAHVYINNLYVGSASHGAPLTYCSAKTCGSFLYFENWNGTGSDTGTYTLTTNSEVFTGTPASSFFYTTVFFEPSYCGCLDPAANNYNPVAYLDNEQCYYVSNATCATATMLEPNTAAIANNSNVPYSNQNAAACGATFGTRLVWFKFVYNGGVAKISCLNTSFDTVLAIYDDCEGNVLACVDDTFTDYSNADYGFFGINASAAFDCEDGLIKGHTYYVGVGMLGSIQPFPIMYEEYQSTGCTDPLATNYNACASIDDGTCIANTCPADLDNSGYVNIADLLQFVSAYGSDCSNL
jgi:hypothetical protein